MINSEHFLSTDWQEFLGEELTNKASSLAELAYKDAIVYPPQNLIFEAFRLCPPDQLKAVIIGQDPYHNPGQAMGLSFSVPVGTKIPPSLRRVFKELMRDTAQEFPFSGDLTPWAKKGVLLLNAMLTVEHNKPGSHKNLGWQSFTDGVIEKIGEKMENKAFLLWGAFAQKKASLIPQEKHLILNAAHPSPLAGNKFAECAHFTKTNSYLKENQIKPIVWKLD